VLSTNDPYQNAQEPTMSPWYIYYNNAPQQKTQSARNIPTVDYSGEKLRGEVIDASTGEALPFTKITFPNFPNVGAVTDFDGKFEITVPKGANYAKASYVGYSDVQLQITAAYLKFFLKPNELQLEEVKVSAYRQDVRNIPMSSYSNTVSSTASGDYELEAMEISRGSRSKSNGKKNKALFDEKSVQQQSNWSPTVATIIQKKDMRMEYTILSKMSIPTDGMDHRVSIGSFDLYASYEYHVIPKIDPSVYLAAQVSGWEKLNLMSGESNIYFDGTFMGKSYLDVNSTKDTLSFSFGKDNKISVDRTRIKEKSKSRTIGSRQKFEVTWEIKVKNNGGAMIPLIVKDQFPISNNADIKVKNGEFPSGNLDEKTGIITWSFLKGITGSQSFTFDYSVDYQTGMTLYLE
jgi:hypothetical protein